MTTEQTYRDEIENWRTQRLASLKGEAGWLNIIGRWELEPGTVTVGSAADNDIVLEVGPAHVGSFTQAADGGVTFTAADGGVPEALELDKKNFPKLTVDRLLLEVTSLNSRNALRIRDRQSTAPAALSSIPHFPVDPAWRIEAQWLPLDTPRTATVDTVMGIPTEVTITHKAVFEHDGETVELLPTHGTEQAPQFVLRDATAGETYPASRFLFGAPHGSKIVLDFNKAINPPCAFSDYAVCPLPPAENVLPFRIEAGELRVAH